MNLREKYGESRQEKKSRLYESFNDAENVLPVVCYMELGNTYELDLDSLMKLSIIYCTAATLSGMRRINNWLRPHVNETVSWRSKKL